MTKLTNAEKEKLDNTCGNLRVTKLGTHVKSLEDFVNEMQLDTMSDTVAEAINELYHMIVDKGCEVIQIPPPGFFTLWGNDEDGKLYCYYNNEDYPPLFKHIEDDSSDLNGTLYLYIADPEGENHYEMEIGHYIAVKHLNDYYTKTQINNLFTGYYKKSETYTQSEINTKLNAKSDTGHKHTKSDITDFPTKVSAFTNDKGYLTSHQSLDDYAKTVYVDQQIANINDDIAVDFASKADADHGHGNINKDGVIANQKSKNVVTDSNGKITTEDKPTIPSANSTASNIKMNGTQNAGSLASFAKADHVHPSDTTKVDKVTGKGLSSNDFSDTLKAKLDAIEAQANNYSHPSSHASNMIVEASALNNIGSAKNADQHTVNDKINSALGTKVDKITGKGLSTNDFSDDLKSKLDGITAGAKAKKRVPGIYVSSDKDKTNQGIIIIDYNTRLRITLFDQENMVNPIDDYENIDDYIIPNTSVNYTINGVNSVVASGGTIGINGLTPGNTYDLDIIFTGSGNYYQVYRSLKLKID